MTAAAAKRGAGRLRAWNDLWRRRAATMLGAVALGLAALGFAALADRTQHLFEALVRLAPLAPLAVTPLWFALLAWLTVRFAPAAKGSGIPQVIVNAHNPDSAANAPLTSLRTAGVKLLLTLLALGVGGSVGREGPTVQISAAIMQAAHRLLRVPLSAAVTIAGGAAGVSAAFNTPLAGVAFAIEELASAYEQRLALLVMGAVMIAGITSLGLAGDYLYFGEMHAVMTLRGDLLVCPAAGVLGGLAGGLFARLILAFATSAASPFAAPRRHPVLLAAACGLLVALIGIGSGGATWGTGYEAARSLIEGGRQSLLFGPEKFLASLATAVSGVPGGIFAPSLATGTGLGAILAGFFPAEPAPAVVTLGMIAYFVGVVRAPLTAVLIISEMTDSRAMILPLFATALVADAVSALVCPEKLYHGLAAPFRKADA